MKIRWYDADVAVPAGMCKILAVSEDGEVVAYNYGEEFASFLPKYWAIAPTLEDVEFEIEHG